MLKGDIYPVNLELTVDGIYIGPATSDKEMLWYHYTYLDELLKQARSQMAGNAGTMFVKAQTPEACPSLMRRIDARFANSESPVRAMTEQAFRQMFTEMLGNVRAYIRNVAMTVVVSLICVAGNAMAMSLRERTREVAVLKAIGFSRMIVLVAGTGRGRGDRRRRRDRGSDDRAALVLVQRRHAQRHPGFQRFLRSLVHGHLRPVVGGRCRRTGQRHRYQPGAAQISVVDGLRSRLR